jgi:hypothetical protein
MESETTSTVNTPSSSRRLSNSGVPKDCSMEAVTAKMRRTTAITPISKNGPATISLSRTIVLTVPKSSARRSLVTVWLPTLTTDQLTIYLADHHAGATFGVELARRTRAQNEGTPYGDFLERLATEIEEDRQQLEQIMDRLGVQQDPLKVGLGWASEKVSSMQIMSR